MASRSRTENFGRIEHLRGKIGICKTDLLGQLSLINILRTVRTAAVDLLQGDASKAKRVLG